MSILPEKLYNITFDLSDNRQRLTPGIPKSTGDTENATIPRICFTDSIENSIQAIASCNRKIANDTVIIVRCVSTACLKPEHIVTPQELMDKKLVPDALENQEYWYKDAINCDIIHKTIKNYDCEYDIAWSCINLNDVKNIIEQYTTTICIDQFKTAKSLYEAFIQAAEQKEQWSNIDYVWEEIVELPWAQCVHVKNIVFY